MLVVVGYCSKLLFSILAVVFGVDGGDAMVVVAVKFYVSC